MIYWSVLDDFSFSAEVAQALILEKVLAQKKRSLTSTVFCRADMGTMGIS